MAMECDRFFVKKIIPFYDLRVYSWIICVLGSRSSFRIYAGDIKIYRPFVVDNL